MTANIDLNTSFAQQVLQAAGSQIPHLQPGVIYITEQILGPAYWNTLPSGKRKSAGIVVKAAMESGLIPLTLCSPPRSDNKKEYQLISD